MIGHDCPHLRSDGRCNCLCSRCYIPAAPVPDVVVGGECVCVRCDTSVCKLHTKTQA